MFWTLDRNGKRYIVKPHGGFRYLCWPGPNKDFDHNNPLAFSSTSSSQPGATGSTNRDETLLQKSHPAPLNLKRSSSSSTDYSDSSSSSATSDSEDDERNRRTTDSTQHVVDTRPEIPSRHIDDNNFSIRISNANGLKQKSAFQDLAPAKRRKTDISSREIAQLNHASPPARRRSDMHASYKEIQPESPRPTNSPSKETVNDRDDKRKQDLIARIEEALDRKLDEVFTPWAGENEGLSRHTLQAIWSVINFMTDNSPAKKARDLNKAVNGGDGKPQAHGGKKPTEKCFKALLASLKSARESDAVSTKIPPADLQSSSSDEDRSTPDEDPELDMLPEMLLPRQKQTRTTLIVRLAPSPEYLPIKLSECMTSQAFYAKVLGGWQIGQDSVAKMTVTFTWMDREDKMRTMAMSSLVDGCFAHLIEQVDEAPTWTEAPEGKGKCVLDVEIVLKG